MRTKVILVCLYTLFTFGACTSEQAKLPEGILAKEKMAEIIADLQLLEAAQKQLNVSTATRNKMRDTSYHVVFNKYGIDSTLYDSSLRVYARHPQVMADIMEEVATQLNTEK